MYKASLGRDFFEKQNFASLLLEDKSPQEIWQIPPDRIEKIYQFACDLYDEKRYQDASDLFLLLTTLSPKEFSFWQGLGFASQQAADLAGAALAYECALSLEPKRADLYPYYLKSLCEMGRKEQALVMVKELMDQEFDNTPQELAEIRLQAESVLRACLG